MSEALHETNDYFSEHGPLLDRLSGRFFEIIAEDDPHTVMELNFAEHSAQILRDSGVRSRHYIKASIAELLHSTETEPLGAFFVATTRVDSQHQFDLECSSLIGSDEAILASHILIVKTDEQIIEKLSLTSSGNTYVDIHHRLLSKDDDLLDLIVKAVPIKQTCDRLTDIIVSQTRKEEMELVMTEILAEYDDDLLEQQFMGHLFGLIRARMQKERQGQATARRLGTDKPSPTELELLLDALGR
jgi:hypothetical protein